MSELLFSAGVLSAIIMFCLGVIMIARAANRKN
jgi:hypothetical protein